MLKINKYNPIKFISLIALFFVMTIALYAQDSLSTPSSSSTASPSSSSNQSLTFSDDAKQLANDLVRRTGALAENSDKISQVIIDYRKDISDARNKAIQNGENVNSSPEVTGSRSRVDMSDILGSDVDQFYKGASPDLMSDYKDADKKADKNIKKILDDDAVKDKYDQVKGQWWTEVKSKVFPSLTQNSEQQQPVK